MLKKIRLFFIHFLIYQFYVTSVFPMDMLLDETKPTHTPSKVLMNSDDGSESGEEEDKKKEKAKKPSIGQTADRLDQYQKFLDVIPPTELYEAREIGDEDEEWADLNNCRINYIIKAMTTPSGDKSPLLGSNKTEMKSSIYFFDETAEVSPSLHTNTKDFCQEFDEVQFNQSTSIETKFLTTIAFLFGLTVAWGWVPTNMYMAAPALEYLPAGSMFANGVVFSLIALTSIAFANQMSNLGHTIGNTLFGRTGFTTTKKDKLPHIKPMDYTVQFKWPGSRHIRFIKVPVKIAAVGLSTVYAAFKAAPRAILFWIAEKYFPIYRGFFIGPLALSSFEQSYNDAFESWKQNFLQRPPSIAVRIEILKDRLKDMRKLLNSQNSADLVAELHNEYQKALTANSPPKQKGFTQFLLRNSQIFKFIYSCLKGPPQEAVSYPSKQRVFIASLFFLRKEINPGVEMSSQAIEEAHRTVTSSRIDPNLRELIEPGVDQSVVEELKGWSRLIEDIESLKQSTQARKFIEGNSNYIAGVAAIGAFLLIIWVADQVFPNYGNHVLLTYQNYDLNNRTAIAGAVALLQFALDPFSEWFTRNKAFLGFRDIFSTRDDFWLFRKCAISLASLASAFGTLAYLAILISFDEAPVLIKVLPALGLMANQFLILYAFFHMHYNDVITKVATTGSKDWPQNNRFSQYRYLRPIKRGLDSLQLSRKRAELNAEIDRLRAIIPDLDDATLEQLYHITQGGL